MKSAKFMLPTAAVLGGLLIIFKSASAQTWVQSDAPSNSWLSVASSADGTKLVAVSTLIQSGTGQIYTTTNSGLNWTVQTNAPATNWTCVASSADGTKLVAVEHTTVYGETNSPFVASGIYTSTDSGVIWTFQTNAPSAVFWTSVVSSPDGNRLAATAAFGTVYLSTDAGTNWVATDLPTNFLWKSIAASTDGSKMAVAGGPGPIYVTTNSGATWKDTGAPITNWICVASSVNGTKFAAASFQSGMYISTNSGINWSQIINVPYTPASNWFAVAFSANDKMIAAGIGAPIYLSADRGETWITNSSPSYAWEAVASSADGNKLVAVTWAHSIWVSQITPAPQLNMAHTNSNLILSWIVPSTNLVLQQSFDLSSWTDVIDALALNLTNLQEEVILPPTNDSSFYRLQSR